MDAFPDSLLLNGFFKLESLQVFFVASKLKFVLKSRLTGLVALIFAKKHMTAHSFHTFSDLQLRNFCQTVFLSIGCSEADAVQAADVLVEADLRGIDSHGVARLSGYVRLWENGRINTKPQITITKSMLSAATVDGDGGLGLVVGPYCMDLAIEKAQKTGCAFISAGNSNHFGIAAYHALKAVDQNMIGISMTNASPLVAPTFSAERMLGTNPMCYAIPGGKYPPFVADLATSAAANGKLEIAERQNKPLPLGWLQDKNGNPTQHASDLKDGGALLPLGGTSENGSHKGYALASVVDILSAVLSGANYGPWVPPFVSFLPLAPNMPGKGLGHFFGVLNIEAFRDLDEFNQNIEKWIHRFKSAKAADPENPVIIPGEPEHLYRVERIQHGIPVIDKVVSDLENLSKKMNIPFH
jgi:LDH2 family malate/lactate/ureidoglycolate dehydrogenase